MNADTMPFKAKDQFGEHTDDVELLEWCGSEDIVLLSNNAKDFEQLHRSIEHAGVFLYHDQNLPDSDPKGFARTVDEVFNQYGSTETTNELVDLDEWYSWLHE